MLLVRLSTLQQLQATVVVDFADAQLCAAVVVLHKIHTYIWMKV
jgi:hypothetical protein